MRLLKIIATVFALSLPSLVGAETYQITVTRESDDLYKVDGTDIYIKTRYCYEYSYSQKAILIVDSPSGYNIGKLIFVQSSGRGNQCDVEKILR
jgi:hypothetical protein